MTTQLDIEGNSRISQNKDGIRIDRIAIVSGVTGTAAQKLKNALEDAGMPEYGDVHPEIAGIYLNEINGEVIDNETVQFTLAYYNDPSSADGGETSFRISSSTAIEQVEEDTDGNRLQAHFISSTWVALDTTLISTGSRLWTAEIERPSTTLDFTYKSSTNPYSDLLKYQGAINSAMFNGNAAGTVLCSFSIDKEGEEFDVRLSFSVNPKGWEFKGAVKIDKLNLPLRPSTDGADVGLDHHTGIKIFNLYPRVDFTPLNMDIGILAASVTGTAVVHPSIDGGDINDGGKTLILTLYNDTWVASGSTFDAQRQNIIDGIISNLAEADGFNDEIALGRIMTVANVIRTSDTVVTITFIADTIYAVTERETITATIPATALVTSATALDTKPTFSINPEPE
jgi:hypothetical protein